MGTFTMVIRVVLILFLIATATLAGIDYTARNKLNTAYGLADDLMDKDVDNPLEFMETLKQTPRVRTVDGRLEQYYRWKGGLNIYDLKIIFYGGTAGSYTLSEIVPSSHSRFSAPILNKLELAQAKTGTLDVEPPEKPDFSKEDEAGRAMAAGSGGGPGGGPGGGRGNSADAFKAPTELKLNAEQQQKWEGVAEFSKAAFDAAMEQRNFQELRTIREDFKKQIKGILTDEQMAQYEKLQPQRGGGGRPSGGSRRGLMDYDEDKDGKVSESEYGKMSERARQFMGEFSALDSNGDGGITKDEADAARQRMIQRFQQGGGGGFGGRGGN